MAAGACTRLRGAAQTADPALGEQCAPDREIPCAGWAAVWPRDMQESEPTRQAGSARLGT